MSIFVSLVGLAFLILIHEAGHFFVARGVGMNPRKFYLGFPPAVVKTRRNGIEYGVGAIPLGGYVKIPGMHRPAPGDLDVHFGRAIEEAPPLGRPVGDLRRHLDENDYDGSGAALERVRCGPTRRVDLAARSAIGRARPHRDPGRARARRLLAGADLEAGRRHLRRPRREPRPCGRHLRRALHVAQRELSARVRAPRHDRQGHRHRQRRARRHARQAAGVLAGDRILAINGKQVDGDSIRPTIQASRGAPLTLTVERGGKTVQLVPVRPEKSEEYGVIGSIGQSFRVTGEVTQEIGRSVGRLVTGDGRDVSSPVGIVQGSSEAVQQGTDTYLWVLGLISLSLALLNLLPLLPLDGGHIAFSLIEGIRGRAVAREVYERVSMVGIAVVLLLFFIGLTNDIGRLGD